MNDWMSSRISARVRSLVASSARAGPAYRARTRSITHSIESGASVGVIVPSSRPPARPQQERDRRPRQTLAARDPDGGQLADLRLLPAEQAARHTHHERLVRLIGPEDHRVGGLVADQVADPGNARPALLRGVDLPAKDDGEVQALRVAGGDRPRAPHHRVRGCGDLEEAERSELVAPHARAELLARRAPHLHRQIGVERRVRPEGQTFLSGNRRRVDQQHAQRA